MARLTGKEPFLTADALRMSRYRMFFPSAKAQARTGLSGARPYREGLEDALAWFGAHGYLDMIAGILFGFLPLAIWLYLLLGRDGFWRLNERDTAPVAAARGIGHRWWRWCRRATKPM